MNTLIVTEDTGVYSMKIRMITALLIIACVVPPLIFGGWMILTLLGFIVIAGGIELMDLTEHKGTWPIIIKPIAIACVFLLMLIDEKLVLPILGIAVLSFLSIPVFTDKFHSKDGFLCIMYIVFFLIIAESFLNIYTSNRLYIWIILIATYGCDTGAYFCGRFLGKHKLNMRISPKKTWEGAIGGWIIGALLAFSFSCVMVNTLTMPQALITCAILAITGQLGDLAFSAIKRNFKIKDFSNLLPGHGGVLDRIDSLVFNFICFNLIMVVLTL